MDKAKNKRMKKYITVISIAVVVLLLALMPMMANRGGNEDGPQASILSGTVETGNITTALTGGGTLADVDTMEVSVPAAVKLKKFLVSNGEKVTEGAPIATVDRVTVMTAIQQVQETLDYLSGEIEKVDDVIETQKVSALAGGTVKQLYAQKGDSVQSVMLEHGALAVLSLDGLMAVELETESALRVGEQVTVTLSGGKAVSGEVASNLAGTMIVTVEDKGYAVGDTVSVSADDGTVIGEGTWYIYSPWKATAYAGTVSSVKTEEGEQLDAGDTLFVLEDLGQSAAYHQLVGQRQEYEDLMLELFVMYQTDTLLAPCDGVVSGIDKESAQLLADNGQGYTLELLANAPNGDDETMYVNYVAQIATVAENGWVLNRNPQSMPIADYLELDQMVVDTALLTQTVVFTQLDLPMFTLVEGAWMPLESAGVGVGDTMLFAYDTEGNPVWGVLVRKGETTNPPQGSDNQTGAEDQTNPEDGTATGTPTFPSGGDFSGLTGTVVQPEETFEMYGLEMAQVAAVIPQSTMTLEVMIDELDISSVQVGMTAQVYVDALGGEKCTATITQIGAVGTNNGGNSKYTVELTMDRRENMLAGMTATAIIDLSATENVPTIPAAALVEQGNKTIVYTGYDKKKEVLTDPVEVKVGVSDGETVEILEGLTPSQTYYYAYYDTLEISNAPDFGGMGMFG